MRSKIGILFMILGIMLFAASLSLLLYNQWDSQRAGRSVAEIQEALEEAKKEAKAEAWIDAMKEADSLSAADGTDESSAGTGEMDADEMGTIEIDGYAYIGTLSIPDFGLELPVMAQWSYPGLKIAPGLYTGSVWTDDMVICGHNYERHFGNLKNLESGDTLTFTDIDDNVFEYQVDEVIILQPTDVEEMVSQLSGDWDLTLFTCTTGGQTRVTVRCSRINY